MSEINLEFLLGAMPLAEATLYRVLVQLIPVPSAESTVAASRQIKLQVIAERTGFSKRWVIELLQRLGKKNFIPTEGGSGAVQWIRLLPLGVPLLGGSEANQSSRKEATSPKPAADGNVAPPVEKPAEIPARRRKGPTASIPPANPAATGNPVAPATTVIPQPPPAPAGPTLPAAGVTPPLAPPSVAPDGPAAGIPVVRRAAKIAPPPAPGNPVVPTDMVPPPAPSAAQGNPSPGNLVVPAARVTPPPPTAPAAPAAPAKRVSPRKSTKKIPAGRSHWESAPIEEMVAYACSLSVTPELIHSLKTPGMTEYLLLLALKRLCQRIERDGGKPYPDRWSLITALRTILIDL